MGNPLYTLRLPQTVIDDLTKVGLVYGAANGRAFAREILEVMLSGDPARVKAFNSRLLVRMGEQLALDLNAAVDAYVQAPPRKGGKPAQDGPRKGRKGRKGV